MNRQAMNHLQISERQLRDSYENEQVYLANSVHRFIHTITPSEDLLVPVERQFEIRTRIDDMLINNPLQGFLFMGPPNTGKTFWLEQLAMYRRSVAFERYALHA